MDPDNYCGMLVKGNADLDNATYISEDDLKGDDLLESLYVGMGFMLVKKGVFETVKWPWFLSTTIPFVNRTEIMVTEDIYFCNKAREAGYKVWIDPTVKVGHQRNLVI